MNNYNRKPKLIILMGVSGCGKTSVAKVLSRKRELEYLEADDFHSSQSKSFMASGIPLNDNMREPWISAMCERLLLEKQNGKDCVLAFSGLKQKHRQRFRELGFETIFLYLNGTFDLIKRRIETRQGHFFNSDLLASQFEAFEPPTDENDVVLIDVSGSLKDVILKSQKMLELY